jgi:hexosaminidase
VEPFYHYPHVAVQGVTGDKLWIPGSCNVYCASSPVVRRFLKDVLTETMALFPGQYIHIGGDEVSPKYWEACDRCKGLMKAKRFTKSEQLQADLTGDIEKFLNAHGRRLIGWDEILKGDLAPSAAVMSWRGTGGGVAAVKAGHAAVMAPHMYLYLNKALPSPRLDQPPVLATPAISLEKVYNYDPMPANLTAGQQKLVLGAEACIWTERLHTPEWLDRIAFPRLCAVAETTWTPAGATNLPGFIDRLGVHRRRLDAHGVKVGS